VVLVYEVAEGEVTGLDAGEELQFQRTATVAGTSAYSVNGNAVSAEDYSKGLLEIGIDMRSKNFLVFQGDVDALAKKPPKAMLDYFELFCGSADHKGPFDAAKAALEDARKDSHGKALLKRTAAGEVKDLRASKEEAERHAAVSAELAALRTRLMLMKLFYMDQHVGERDAELARAAAALDAAAAEERAVEAKQQEVAKAAAGATKTAAKREVQLSAKAAQVREAEERVVAAEERIKSLKATLTGAGGAEKAAAEALSAVRAEVEALRAEVAALEAEEAEAAEEEASGGAAGASKKGKRGGGGGEGAGAGLPALSEAQRREYNELKVSERQATAEDRDALSRLERERAGEEADVGAQRASLAAVTQRAASLAAEAEKSRVRRKDLAGALERIRGELEGRKGELLRCDADIGAAQARHAALGGELKEVVADIDALHAAEAKSASEKRVEKAVEDMKRLFNGVRGRLVDLVETKTKSLNLAMSVALGRHADEIVVNTEATAIECIKYLRDHRIRPLTFLPLDVLRVPELEDGVAAVAAKQNSPFKLARDCVTFVDADIERAVFFACGSTLIAKDLDAAMEARYGRDLRTKVVTLEGAVIARNGNMTGGASGDRGADFGRGGSRWDEKMLRAATEKRDKLLNEEERMKRALARARGAGVSDAQSLYALRETLAGHVGNDEARLSKVEAAIVALDAQLKTLGEEAGALKAEAARSAPAIAEADARAAGREKKMAALTARIEAAGDKVFAAFTAATGIADIRVFESTVVARAEAAAKARAARGEKLARLRSQLEYESSRAEDTAGALALVRKEAGGASGALADAEAAQKAAAARAAALRAEEGPLRDELEAAKAAHKACETSRDALHKERKRAAEKKAGEAKSLAALESALERLRAARHELLQTAQVEKLPLPMKGGGGGGGGGAAAAAAAPGGGRARRGSGGAAKRDGGGGKKGKRRGGMEDEDVEERGEEEEEEEEEEGGGGGGGGEEEGGGGGAGGIFTQTQGGGMEDEGSGAHFSRASDPAMRADARRSARIDFDAMDSSDRGLSAEGVDARARFLENAAARKAEELATLNFARGVGERYADAEARLKAAFSGADEARAAVAAAEKRFQDVQTQRKELLLSAFEKVASVVDGIYKELTRSEVRD
jgi:structural maintenance of chromosome 1